MNTESFHYYGQAKDSIQLGRVTLHLNIPMVKTIIHYSTKVEEI